MSEHEIRQLDQEYGRVEDRRQERLTKPHTPGPWRTHINSLNFADGVYAGDTWIADLDCATTGSERAANARLIAAAPEMLEALESIESAIQGLKLDPALKEATDHAWEVTQKARGGQ